MKKIPAALALSLSSPTLGAAEPLTPYMIYGFMNNVAAECRMQEPDNTSWQRRALDLAVKHIRWNVLEHIHPNQKIEFYGSMQIARQVVSEDGCTAAAYISMQHLEDIPNDWEPTE